MAETMYEAPASVWRPRRRTCKQIVVIDVWEDSSQPPALINRRLSNRQGEQEGEEGC